MAGTVVTMSSVERMAVKEEEGESSGNNHNPQVILHLQPILQGINDNIADTGTTVMAIETRDNDSKAEGEEIEYGYPITCGNSRAVLLFKKFVCPGINVRCVKFNDQLISPKQFVHLAGKATLKDWKRAIRLGGVMLRKMMGSGQIDFYQHDTVCSNTCRSTKFDVVINSTRLPPGTSVQPSSSFLALDPLGGQVPPLTGRHAHDTTEVQEPLEDRFRARTEGSPGPALPVNPPTANGHAAKRRLDTSDGVLSLWKGVANAGLMGEVLSSLQTELLATLKGVEVRSKKASLEETDAIILNSLCEMFGLLDSVKHALDLRHSQNQENKILNGVYVLSEIMEEQRKQGCYKNTFSKRFRPQRYNPSNRQTQSVLSPVKTSPLISPLSIAGFSGASYAQLSYRPQLFTDFSTSTGRNHLSRADSVTLGRVHEYSEPRSQKKPHQLGLQGVKKENTSGSDKDPDQRTKVLSTPSP